MERLLAALMAAFLVSGCVTAPPKLTADDELGPPIPVIPLEHAKPRHSPLYRWMPRILMAVAVGWALSEILHKPGWYAGTGSGGGGNCHRYWGGPVPDGWVLYPSDGQTHPGYICPP